jgi:protein-tyrosine phosphatase
MDWITDTVAIGTREEAFSVGVLSAAGIRSVLCLDGSLHENCAADLGVAEVVAVPLLDGFGNDEGVFRHAVDSLIRLASTRAPVLVHCQYGRSRSPAVVAGYLVRVQGIGPLQAQARVASRREISISAALLPLLFLQQDVDKPSQPAP